MRFWLVLAWKNGMLDGFFKKPLPNTTKKFANLHFSDQQTFSCSKSTVEPRFLWTGNFAQKEWFYIRDLQAIPANIFLFKVSNRKRCKIKFEVDSKDIRTTSVVLLTTLKIFGTYFSEFLPLPWICKCLLGMPKICKIIPCAKISLTRKFQTVWRFFSWANFDKLTEVFWRFCSADFNNLILVLKELKILVQYNFTLLWAL